MITLILADDHQLVRKSLKLLLQMEAGFQVVAEAADGTQAIELVEKKKPTLLLLDLAMPRTHGLDVIGRVSKMGHTKVLVLSMYSADTYIIEAVKNGASGYVLKQCAPADLIKGIRQICAGRSYFSPSLPGKEILALLKNPPNHKGSGKSISTLTRREKIVLQLAADGKSNAEIAQLLFLSRRTVENHRSNFMHKLKLKSQTEIVRFAIRKNMISA